ncbi:MAG: hypothetical protein NC394_10020, partial [Bacteroides sp.]|nr:hypothetical protein [Bacteroides sp.]
MKGILRRITALGTALAVMSAAVVFDVPQRIAAMAATSDNCPVNHGGWTEWRSTNSLPTTAGTYYLKDNVNVTAQTTISADITLCLNGYTIDAKSKSGIFEIVSGGSLTLCDCSSGKTGTLTGGKSTTGGAIYVNGGTFTMNGGCISGNKSNGHGGGVYVNSGTFIMNGGEISGNTGGLYAGGVCNYGTFKINGGSIINNKCTNGIGGGVSHRGGSLEINGKVMIAGNIREYTDQIIDYETWEIEEVKKEVTNNLALDSGKLITIGENFSTDSSIGVAVSGSLAKNCGTSMPITDTGISADISGSFISDQRYYVGYEDSTVKLIYHSFDENWSKNETYHWYEATCEHTDLVIEKRAHTWGDGEVTTEPTEENEGVRTYTCVCGASKTEPVEKLEHTHVWGDWEITQNPTTTEKGSATHTCTKDTSHTETAEVPALNDSDVWTKVSHVEPTEEQEGKDIYTSDYGEVEVVLPKKEHTHTLDKTDEKAATCTEGGNEAYWTCSKCNKMFSDENGTTEISAVPTISALGHNWDEGIVTTAQTCTEKGVKTFACKRDNCTETKTEEIAAAGHTEVTDA